MDDDKSIIQKISDTVRGAVDSVSEAAMQAMIPTKIISPDPAAVAGATNEQMYVSDAAAMPMTSALTEQKPISDRKHVQKILNDAAARPAKKRTVKAPAKKSKSPTARKAIGKKKKAVKKAKKTKKSKR